MTDRNYGYKTPRQIIERKEIGIKEDNRNDQTEHIRKNQNGTTQYRKL